MSLRVSFELDADDLKHFRLVMRDARRALAGKSPEEIIAAADTLIRGIGAQKAPSFVTDRVQKLDLLRRMISDLDWRLPHGDTQRVLNALAYFVEPDDLIPDHIPGLGFLDDAIMIELLVRELRHEIEAYRDFVEYRQRELRDSAGKGLKQQEARLESRRKELHARLSRRRERDAAQAARILE